jgi:O-antigen ligase
VNLYVLLALGTGLLAAFFRLAREPLAAVAVVPAGAGVALLPIPNLPVDLLVAHALAAVAIAGVLSHLLLYPDRRKVHLPSGRALAVCGWITLFGVVVLVSAVMGLDRLRFVSVTVSTLIGLCYGLCVVAVVNRSRDMVLLLAAFAFGAVTATAPALKEGGHVESQFGGAVVSGRATGAFGDPNELGVYSAVALVLCLTFALTTRTRWAQGAGVVAALICFGALLASYSRLSWLAAPVGILVLVLHAPARRFVLRVAPPLAGLGVLGLLLVGVRFPLQSFLQRLESLGSSTNPDDVRLQAWREAFRLIWERPVIGWGPGSFQALSETPPSVIWASPLEHPHNALLTALVEQGFTGGLVLVAMAVALVAGLIRTAARRLHPDPAHRTLTFGCLAALALLTVNVTADYQLRNPYVMLTAWFLLGTATATLNLSSAPGPATADGQPPPPVRRVPVTSASESRAT